MIIINPRQKKHVTAIVLILNEAALVFCIRDELCWKGRTLVPSIFNIIRPPARKA